MTFPIAHGSVPPVITPMTPDASGIDRDGIAALVEWHIHAGTTGLFFVCSTGEMFDLAPDEMVEVARTAVKAAAGRIPIIAGLPFPDVERKALLARRYQEVGVSGAVALQPYEDPPDDDSMYEHYARLAEGTSVPILIYEHPRWKTTHLLSPALVGRLSATGRYVGMKDCTGDVDRLAAMAEAGKGRFGVMQAVQEQLLSAFLCGGSAACCTGSNVSPHLYRRLFDLVKDRNIEEAYRVQVTIRNRMALYAGSKGAKYALNRLGLPIHRASRQKRPLTAEQIEGVTKLADLVKSELPMA